MVSTASSAAESEPELEDDRERVRVAFLVQGSQALGERAAAGTERAARDPELFEDCPPAILHVRGLRFERRQLRPCLGQPGLDRGQAFDGRT